MICALCKLREANKKNTHYLTDGIIRSALNQGGSKEREKGLYFDLSNDTAFVRFNFQRNTSVAEVEATLGRAITDEEIDAAKKVPFSVDDIFCNVCEDIFSAIESEFIDKILPLFRGADLSKTDRVIVADGRLARLFFYLQIWRAAVCTDVAELPEAAAESLRLVILDHADMALEAINQFLMIVTYLETTGGDDEYTSNLVGYVSGTSPGIVFMNDFIIQFYGDSDLVGWFDFYGLNDPEGYSNFVNYGDDQLLVNVFHNMKRKQFIHDMLQTEKVKPTVDLYRALLVKGWQHAFGETPSEEIQKGFFAEVTSNEKALGVKYTKEQLLHAMVDFVAKHAEQ